ncbi:iron-containing alcohol dehydrogenase family protein [Cetobacterium sp.]|uniref:iron-containing alcohol dehydrogenase family protein n=1 Tax=Cetobacterium sp. TaxID=2071632 RepID=UPI003EE5923C
MNSFNLPLFLKVERNLVENIFEIIKEEGINLQKILLITDKFVYSFIGNKVLKSFQLKEISIELEILEENSLSKSLEISKKIIESEISTILGIGGGKVLDTAKYVSFISKTPYIGVPTTLANDGIVSPISVLLMEDGKTKSLGAKVPSGIIIDLNIIMDSPIDLIKAGIGDTLSNYTAIEDWKLSKLATGEKIDDFSILLSELSFNSLFYFNDKNLKNERFIRQLCESIVLSGLAMEIAGVSRPCSGSEHLFSHAIDLFYPEKKNLHGLQVALGSIVSAFLQGKNYKKLILFLKELSINVSPTNLNISLNEFIYAWINGKNTRKGRYTILDETENLEKKLLEIYNEIEEEFR